MKNTQLDIGTQCKQNQVFLNKKTTKNIDFHDLLNLLADLHFRLSEELLILWFVNMEQLNGLRRYRNIGVFLDKKNTDKIFLIFPKFCGYANLGKCERSLI